MANGKIAKYADMVALQVASEAFLSGVASSDEVKIKLNLGNTENSILPKNKAALFGEGERYILIAHQDLSLNANNSLLANNKSGFSASLFYDIEKTEYTLSFRSTEFASQIRDYGDISADLDILNSGWAFGQVRSMELFWNNLLDSDLDMEGAGITVPSSVSLADFRNAISGGTKLNVTGYSLGGNLAQAFTDLHRESVINTYLFNAAGTGKPGLGVSTFDEVFEAYQNYFDDPSSFFLPGSELDYGEPDDPNDAVVRLNIQEWYASPDAVYESLYDNPRHFLALQVINDLALVIDAAQSSSLALDPADVPHQADDKVIDIWASNYEGDSGPDVFVARSGARHGESRPVWYEDQPLAYWDALVGEGTLDWGTGHSIVLLQDSLALMAAFERLAPDVNEDQLAEIFRGASQSDFDTLEASLDALGRIVGITGKVDSPPGDGSFADMGLRNAFHDKLAQIQESPAYLALEGNIVLEPVDADALLESARTDFGQFLSLYYFAPFGFRVTDADVEAQMVAAHGQLGADWVADRDLTAAERAQGLANISDALLEDRARFLTAFSAIASEDLMHGQMTLHGYFSDIEYGIGFNTDEITYGGGEISDLRARLAFGSQGNDINTLQASSQADRLYGLAGIDLLFGLDGGDYIEGGTGNDLLIGGEGDDQLLGGVGNDILGGGIGNDYLLGGRGADLYFWSTGDGDDVIAGYDDGGDRIIVNGVDLATVDFVRLSPESSFYLGPQNSDLALHLDGGNLMINILAEAENATISVSQFGAVEGADYGIALMEYSAEPPPTDLVVTRLGTADSETAPSAWWRQQSGQGGYNWSDTALYFDAESVANYSGGSLHGTLGGAFEGGPVADYLTGDEESNALHGLAGNDLIEGDSGDDFLEGGAGADSLFGGDGNDLLFGNARAGLADALNATNEFYLAQITEQAGDSNRIAGGNGDDHISGGDYTDYLDGGPGADYLLGGAGGDFISGGPDGDVIYGDSALHYRYVELTPGVAGEQLQIAFIDGESEFHQFNDVIRGGAGSDIVWGELGDDELYGDEGDDNLIGDRYNDADYFSVELPAYSDTSPELSFTFGGSDRLFGGDGDDLLLGLAGDDLLVGGTGTDNLVGGAGDDTYSFTGGDGLDFVDDTEGVHTLLFTGMATGDLQISFQGEEVRVGTTQDGQGFTLAKDEWADTLVAVDTVDAVIERSMLDTVYLDAAGNVLLSIDGNTALTEDERDAVVSVDNSDPHNPRLVFGGDAREVEFQAREGGGVNISVLSESDVYLYLNILGLALEGVPDAFDMRDLNIVVKYVVSGNFYGFEGDDYIVGDATPNVLEGEAGNDVLEGRAGDDELYGGFGDDRLLGENGDDQLFGGYGTDYLDGGRGNDILEGGYSRDIYRFDAGDGQDTINPAGLFYAAHTGEILLGERVDLDSLSFTFSSGKVDIGYGAADRITLDPESIYGFRDNALNVFTVVSEADAGWIPTIRDAGNAGVLHGTYGTDHLVGDASYELVMPGYGDDIIEAGGGGDLIVLNEVYIGERSAIGNKELWAGSGDDRILTPLHQGLTVHYDLGDGHDTIVYDWSYGYRYPYTFGADTAQGVAYFEANGRDSLAFGEGILLQDLSFTRVGEALRVALEDGSGSILVEEFFHAYELDQPAWTGDIVELLSRDFLPNPESLLHPALLAALPPTPVSELRFADGSVYDMVEVLGSFLQQSEATLLGTEDDDILIGTSGDDVIHALGGNDFIQATDGGSNVILAGDGDDTIIVASDSTLDAGSGDDWLTMVNGDYVIGFGPGSDTDTAFLDVATAAAVVEVGAALTLGDIDISLTDSQWGEVPLLTLVATGDSMQLVGAIYDDMLDDWQAVPGTVAWSLRFADGDIITGDEIHRLAAGISNEIITGTEDNDYLLGTEDNDSITGGGGNDWMFGAGGDDIFTVEGTQQGSDYISGGHGFDTIRGGLLDDRIGLLHISATESVERIDGGPGFDVISGTGSDNILDLSNTELLGIEQIEGGGGSDRITGSASGDVIVGGTGDDLVSGFLGNDSYEFAMGDGRDEINNDDIDPTSFDQLQLVDIDYDQVWLSRQDDDLAVDIVGSTDRLLIKNWYEAEEDQIDAIHASNDVLISNQVDQLVNAMAAYDIPSGVGVVIPEQTRLELEPVLTAVWQLTG